MMLISDKGQIILFMCVSIWVIIKHALKVLEILTSSLILEHILPQLAFQMMLSLCVSVCVFVCAPRRYMWGRKQCVQSMVFISTVPTTQGWKLIIPLEWVHTARQSCSRLLMVRGVCWNWLSFQSMTDGLFVCLTFDSALLAVLISLYIFTQGIFLSASFFVKQVSWCNFIWPM